MSNKKQHDEEHSKIYKVWLWVKRWWLPIAILLITSTGLACALSIPQQVFETPREPANDKSAPVLLAQSNLRLAFLYITGGAIAVVGLIETFRKNNNEKLKNDQDKEKNDREHLRQVRADRRERYTKAVEQLGDEKSPIRMGGVYTLVGLVDEWLEDESIEKYEDRLKEGQVIVNNLCAYIRSPFTLASHYNELSEDAPSLEGIYKDKKEEFYVDKAILDSEADVRLSIIKEIHDRIQDPDKNTPGAWSGFEYDFSGSTFFYPIDLTNSYYAKPINFSGSTYKGWADFCGSTYQALADFSRSTYQALADFSRSTYQALADFSRSTYQGRVDFNGSTYQALADFRGSTYQGRVDFSGSIYQGGADFSGSIYQGGAYFTCSIYQGGAYFTCSTYTDWADFRGSTYTDWAYFTGSTYQGGAYFTGSTYTGWADFRDSTYTGWADFRDSTYTDWADFRNSTYQGGADFRNSTYQGGADFRNSTYTDWADFRDSTYQGRAYFSRSIFYSETYFGKDKYSNSFSCFTNRAPQFYDKKNRKNTLFGSHNNDFTVDIDKGYPINLDSEGLPLGCKFLTSEQKEYLADKFQEIEKINNELREIKDPKEKAELSRKLQALNKELYEWWEEATTVKVEDVAAEDTES
ncbi:pentapeptide repeat-containing protein [Rothia dentocariosa]|uniref:pentapeptide repeat-containing protein n=2 Tax=Rothia dentocariosa TaxID=2047 RepID=UPI001560DD58|nr:pentapeptide repeat-containing protein [Rothia dentocariosa]QKI09806.1 pentapeptide repeat-containing protein [Rothia dentocariosa]